MVAKDKETLRQKAKMLKSEVYALYFAYRDPRVPWYAKLWVAIIVGYAFSPIDFIPDFIPVLGYLDDVILIPLLIALAIKMIPKEVMQEAREKAKSLKDKPKNIVAAVIIVLAWIFIALLGIYVGYSFTLDKGYFH